MSVLGVTGYVISRCV